MLMLTEFARRLLVENSIIDAATAADGPFYDLRCKLFAAPYNPTDQSVLADLTAIVATFTGHAEKTITWSDIQVAANRQWFVSSQALLWICSADPASAETIYGVYYYVGTDLIAVDVFDTPVVIDEAGDSVQHIATVP